jgi:hypothetical protein
VNGKRFFPILSYDVPTDPESLKMFREHGFNTLTCQPEVSDLLLANGFYTAVHGLGTDSKKQAPLVFIPPIGDSPVVAARFPALVRVKPPGFLAICCVDSHQE